MAYGVASLRSTARRSCTPAAPPHARRSRLTAAFPRRSTMHSHPAIPDRRDRAGPQSGACHLDGSDGASVGGSAPCSSGAGPEDGGGRGGGLARPLPVHKLELLPAGCTGRAVHRGRCRPGSGAGAIMTARSLDETPPFGGFLSPTVTGSAQSARLSGRLFHVLLLECHADHRRNETT
jgi:hypothetical protein